MQAKNEMIYELGRLLEHFCKQKTKLDRTDTRLRPSWPIIGLLGLDRYSQKMHNFPTKINFVPLMSLVPFGLVAFLSQFGDILVALRLYFGWHFGRILVSFWTH